MNEPTPKQFGAQLGVYSVSHAAVDFACGYFGTAFCWPHPDGFAAIVIYNAFAFAGQMPLGIFADRLNRNAPVAAVGCVLVAVALLAHTPDILIPCAVIAGIGNACFHMGGGIDVLNASGKKSGPLGIFVAPGTVGLFLGLKLGLENDATLALPLAALAVSAIAIMVLQKAAFGDFVSRNVPLSFRMESPRSTPWVLLAVAALFFIVAMRAYVGFTLSFDWKEEWHWAAILIVAIFAGKTMGGILSDHIGMQRTAIATLLLSATLFMFPDVPVAGVIAVFCFNMTMPMTLWALSQIFSRAKGFAFGTLTCALFVGVAITYVHPAPLLPMGRGFSLATLLSLVLLVSALVCLPSGKDNAKTSQPDAAPGADA